jgi:hypothetical protein
MFASFLPAAVRQLTEPSAIALAQSIEQIAISTPLSTQPINTTYVHNGSGGTPILLIHGFDSSLLEFRRLLPLLAENNDTWAVDLWVLGLQTEFLKYSLAPLQLKLIFILSGKP